MYRYGDTDIYCGNISAYTIQCDKFNLFRQTLLPLLLIRSDNGKQAIPCCDITKALKVQTINSGRNVYVSFVAVRRCRSAEKITRRVATCHCQLVIGGSCKLVFFTPMSVGGLSAHIIMIHMAKYRPNTTLNQYIRASLIVIIHSFHHLIYKLPQKEANTKVQANFERQVMVPTFGCLLHIFNHARLGCNTNTTDSAPRCVRTIKTFDAKEIATRRYS